MAKRKRCDVDDCTRTHYARGFCELHYQRWWRTGDPLALRGYPPGTTRPAEVRFWEKVDRNGQGGCWLWTAGRWGHGYGYFWASTRGVMAHRYAYELMVGPIPEGLDIDHLCRVRHCCNPDHLEPVTRSENLRRGAVARSQIAWPFPSERDAPASSLPPSQTDPHPARSER